MSRSARKRGGRGRIQPYAWLGAGAVTVGMGVAMVGGAAVAFADEGAGSTVGASSASNRSTSESAGAASTKSDAPASHRRANRASRVAAEASGTDTSPDTSVRKGRVAPALDLTDVTSALTGAVVKPEATPAAAPEAADGPLPAAAVATAPAADQPAVAPKRASRGALTVVTTQPGVDGGTLAEGSSAAAAAPAADPAPVLDSWLPGGSNPGAQIVPGTHVQLALQEIASAQGILTAQTWGSGNIIAGVVAIVPQLFLVGASLSLTAWGATNPGVQSLVAGTAGIPLIHQIAQVTLLADMLLPPLAEASLGGAALFMPLVNVFGANVGAAQAEVASARENGKVYAVVPVRMVAGTQPVVGVSVNGGATTTLLVDTGASGLVTTRDQVGSGDLGPIVGGGNSCFSGGLCYHYDTYNTTVDLGNGAVTTAPVNIVTNTPEYPDSVTNFKDFFSWGADGIIGVGANTAGPGPAPIPTAVMPGELSDGLLIYENALPFGLGGFMVLGPNAFPTRVSVPGAPDSFVKVSVNGGPKNDAGAIIDSGGVYGTLNSDLYYPGTLPPEAVDLPAGTKIDVYSADGATLLYSYTTQGDVYATQVIDAGLFNTGNAPFAQSPIYINYGYNNPYGIGSTDFSIW